MDEKIVRAYRTPGKQALAVQMRRDMTPSEALLWERLRANRLGGLSFRRQQVIGGFVADFYYRSARLVIECDGEVHERQGDYDRARDEIIATYNLRVVRFSDDAITHNLSAVLADILSATK